MKRFSARVLAVAMCMGLTSCSSHSRPPTIAIIERTGGTGFWNLFARSANERARRYGFHLQWADPQSAADYEVQARLLNNAVQQHVSGIILAPAHQLVLAEGVRRAHLAGIPVVIVESPIAVQLAEYVTSIGCGDDSIGFMARSGSLPSAVPDRASWWSVPAPRCRRRRSGKRHCGALCSGHRPVIRSWSLDTACRTGHAHGRPRSMRLRAIPASTPSLPRMTFPTHGVLSALRSVKHRPDLAVVGVDNDIDAQEAVRSGLMSMAIRL